MKLCPLCISVFLLDHKPEDLGDEIPALHIHENDEEFGFCHEHKEKNLKFEIAEARKATKPYFDAVMAQSAISEPNIPSQIRPVIKPNIKLVN